MVIHLATTYLASSIAGHWGFQDGRGKIAEAGSHGCCNSTEMCQAHYGQGLMRLLKEVPNLFLREFGRASEKQNIKTGI